MSIILDCRALRVASIIFILFFFTHESGRSRGDEPIISEEVINKWKEYELFSQTLQGKVRRTTTRDGKTEHTLTLIKQNQNCILSCTTSDEPGAETCMLTNSRYLAMIKKNQKNGEYHLSKFSADPQDDFPSANRPPFDIIFSTTSPHFCAGTFLSRFAVSPSLKVIKVSKEQDNGRELVRIDYTYLNEDRRRQTLTRKSGSIYLAPDACWCVRRHKAFSKLEYKGKPTLDQEYENKYETIAHPSGYPLVKAEIASGWSYNYNQKKKSAYEKRIEYEWDVNDHIPDTEFTLSAFGLPEPGSDSVQKPAPLYLWLLLAAAVCALLALSFWYLMRRSRRVLAA